MDHKILKTVFWVGSLFGLTPPTTLFQKTYSILIFLLYNVGIILTIRARKMSHYWSFSPMQSVLRLVLNCNLYFHYFYVVMILGLTKRTNLIRLITNLRKIKQKERKLSEYQVVFFLSYLVMIVVLSINIYVWYNYLKFDFLKLHLIEYLEMHTQFFYTLFACIILAMIFSRYKAQTRIIIEESVRKKISNLTLQDISLNLVILQRTVESFNEIFGWTILYNIFFVAVKTLIYLDLLIKNYTNVNTFVKSHSHMTSHVTILLLFWVSLKKRI